VFSAALQPATKTVSAGLVDSVSKSAFRVFCRRVISGAASLLLRHWTLRRVQRQRSRRAEKIGNKEQEKGDQKTHEKIDGKDQESSSGQDQKKGYAKDHESGNDRQMP
jgi:hypothetical protein